jgi:hypothetical protein
MLEIILRSVRFLMTLAPPSRSSVEYFTSNLSLKLTGGPPFE